jgi:hypothetical protein
LDLLIIAECEINKDIAQRDIDKNKPRLLLSGGIAPVIYSEQSNNMIYSDVSITAKGFFESKGFIVERQQLKKSKQKELINFRMIKNKE